MKKIAFIIFVLLVTSIVSAVIDVALDIVYPNFTAMLIHKVIYMGIGAIYCLSPFPKTRSKKGKLTVSGALT